MKTRASEIVLKLLECDEQAEEIYQKALNEYPVWWEFDGDPGEKADEIADEIMDRFYQFYHVEPGSQLADDIYERIMAGLT
jgi:hypothetical protein